MNRRAFSLIELLVVIAILAVLMGMLLPAVQVIRGAASRIKCASNLHQLAITMHGFHDEYKRFPPGLNVPISGELSGAVWPSNPLVLQGKIKEPPHPGQFISWPQALLPFYEQDNLQRSLDLRQRDYFNCRGPDSVGAQVIEILICPADHLPNKVTTYQSSGETYYFGMNSYGANGGTRSWPVSYNMRTDGMFFINSNLRIHKISDGLANTIMFGERFHFDPNFRNYSSGNQFENMVGLGGWAWSNYNSPQDYILSAAVPINFNIPDGINGDSQATMNNERVNAYGSGHPRGANFAMCDGSVRFLTLTANRDLKMLQALSTPAGNDKAVIIE